MYVDNNCGENNVSRHVPISDYRQPRLDSQLIESLEISPCGILTITCIGPAVISLTNLGPCCQTAFPVETCRCYRYLSPFIEQPSLCRAESIASSVLVCPCTHLMMWALVNFLWKAPWCENRRAIGLVISVSEYWRRLRHVIERRERRGYFVLRMLFFALYWITRGASMALYFLVSSPGRVFYLDRVLQSVTHYKDEQKRLLEVWYIPWKGWAGDLSDNVSDRVLWKN